MANKVSFYSVPSYDIKLVEDAVRKIFDDFGGIDKICEGKKKVVIKPNLVIKKSPSCNATTNPAILEAVLEILSGRGLDIVCAECSGGPNTPALMKAIYRDTGMASVLEKFNVPFVTEMHPVQMIVKDHLSCPVIDIQKEFCDADLFINLAKIKTHSLTVMSGAAKNLYGMIPGLRKIEYHARFPEIEDFAGLIVDLNRTIKPDISIVDGVWGMEKDGPTGGVSKFAGAIFGSDNVWALDSALCDFMGIEKNTVPILKRAKDVGLSGDYEIIGDDMEKNKPTPFILPDSKKKQALNLLPDIFGGRLNKFLSPHPSVNKSKCRACGECVRMCPQKTIKIENKKAKINHKNCIRCWCCQEMCPYVAIEAKSRFFLHT